MVEKLFGFLGALYKTIKDANIHSEVVNIYISNLEKINYDKRDMIKEKFSKLGYYNGN